MARRTPELACPRCGYDVSGVVPTWTDACPLDGRCSECGLTFAWVDVFRPDRVAPTWSFEHARERIRMRWYATAARSLGPSFFWRGISLAAPIRVARLVWFGLIVLAIGWLGTAACGAWLGYELGSSPMGGTLKGWSLFPSLPSPWDMTATIAVWPGWSPGGWQSSLIQGGPVFVVLWAALAGAPFLILRQSLTRAKCRTIHLLRGWVYQWPATVILVLPVLFVRAGSTTGPVSFWVFGGFSWLVFLAGLWLAWHWTSFTRTYLRLPHAMAVAAAMLVIAGLTVLVVDYFISPQHRSLLDAIGHVLA